MSAPAPIAHGIAWRRTMRRLLLGLGVAFLLVAGLGYMDYGLLGFPDGHLTVFERETRDLRFALLLANAALGVLACAFAFGGTGLVRPLAVAMVAGFFLVAIPSFVLPNCPRLDACIRVYEAVVGHPPDHGIGG